jgi:hypothetical protein
VQLIEQKDNDPATISELQDKVTACKEAANRWVGEFQESLLCYHARLQLSIFRQFLGAKNSLHQELINCVI